MSAEARLEPVMTDEHGFPAAVWLPEQQSDAFLRQQISLGIRTAECWSQIRMRNLRVQAAMRAIAEFQKERETISS